MEDNNVALPTLYEDADLLICNKPSGVLSESKIFNSLLPKYLGKLELIHRLDKETSGAILVAKNPRIKDKMIDLFFQKKVRKLYCALVEGRIHGSQGTIDSPVKKAGLIQPALTVWKCIGRGAKASLLLCEPVTGRTHQLRIHLSAIHHPILGDFVYGGGHSSFSPKRHLLHAYQLHFCHPITQAPLSIIAPLPEDFEEMIGISGIKRTKKHG